MAKAQITTPQGVKINVVGTPAEISAVIRDLEIKETDGTDKKTQPDKPKRGKIQLVDLIASLCDDGFFKNPRDLSGIKSALAEMGHHYPVTTLSGAMLKQVRKRNIRRIREEKRWVYVQ
jgi:hypothetical protein